MGLQRERLVRILQRQQATDLAGAIEFLTVILTFNLQGEGIVLRGSAFFLSLFRFFLTNDFTERNRLAQRINQHIQLGLQRLVIKRDVAFVELDGADIHRPVGRFCVRVFRVEGERPVGATVSQTHQIGTGFGQLDTRDDHGLGQQRQRRQARLDPFKADHLRRFGPLRITQGQVLRNNVRPRHPCAPATFIGFTLPLHRQVAIDGKRAMEHLGHLGVDRGLETVPVEGGDQHHQHGQQQDKNPACPGKRFTGARHDTAPYYV